MRPGATDGSPPRRTEPHSSHCVARACTARRTRMRTKHENLLEDRLDDLARRLRAIEEWFGEADRRDAEAPAAEEQAKPYMTTREAAGYLGLSPSILEQWRSVRPGGPAYRKVGRRVVYARTDLDNFLQERCRSRPLLGRPSRTD